VCWENARWLGVGWGAMVCVGRMPDGWVCGMGDVVCVCVGRMPDGWVCGGVLWCVLGECFMKKEV
jgi:hypothetical protein